jgi:hypothetical protein
MSQQSLMVCAAHLDVPNTYSEAAPEISLPFSKKKDGTAVSQLSSVGDLFIFIPIIKNTASNVIYI